MGKRPLSESANNRANGAARKRRRRVLLLIRVRRHGESEPSQDDGDCKIPDSDKKANHNIPQSICRVSINQNRLNEKRAGRVNFTKLTLDTEELLPARPKLEIDIDHLLSMTGGDANLADEVLDIFRNQADTWGRMLSADLSQREWADAAHTLKGAALSIGAHTFADACAAVEQEGRGEADVSHVRAATILSELKDQLGQVIEACAKASYELSKPGLRRSNDSNS